MATYNLRDYQIAAADAVIRDFETYGSTLATLPTGCGKTIIASEIVRRFQSNEGACIWIAHREELLYQARKAIETHCGSRCEFELGEHKASEIFIADVTLGSIQSLISGRNGSRRMNKFSPYNYSLLVIDEFHHSTAASYRTVLDYFRSGNPDLKVLGITATPERSDEEALGQICESVAFDYSILQAIQDGWLVPVQQQLIDIQSLDFSHIRTTAGDLNQGDLAAVMEQEKNLYGICDATMKELGTRKAIMFCTSVKQTQMAAQILNRYRQGVAAWASGKTPKEDRARIMADFHAGAFQILVNCNLVSEGFDVPDAELLIQARPTKSKLLYQQQLGRIMRPLPDTVEGLENALARRQAIARTKPVATVMDFVGNAGRHKLIHSLDILGGRISEKVRELAERELRKSGMPQRVDELVLEAERMEREERERADAAKKAILTARARYTSRLIDPFDSFELIRPPERHWGRDKHLSLKQRALLQKQGMDPDKLSYSEGKQLIDHLFHRWKAGLASLKQCALLKKRGFETRDLTRDRASQLITEIANREGWRQR